MCDPYQSVGKIQALCRTIENSWKFVFGKSWMKNWIKLKNYWIAKKFSEWILVVIKTAIANKAVDVYSLYFALLPSIYQLHNHVTAYITTYFNSINLHLGQNLYKNERCESEWEKQRKVWKTGEKCKLIKFWMLSVV